MSLFEELLDKYNEETVSVEKEEPEKQTTPVKEKETGDTTPPEENSQREDVTDNGEEYGAEPEETSPIEQLMSLEGYLEEAPREYDNSVEGVKAYLEDRDKKRDTEIVKNFLSSDPQLASFYKHTVVEGKDPKTFIKLNHDRPSFMDMDLPAIDGSTTEPEKKKINNQYDSVIKQYYSKKGLPEEAIDGLLESTKNKHELAKSALEGLKSEYQESINKEEEARKQEQLIQEQEAKQTLQEINNIIDKNDFGDFKIPESELGNFKNYVTVPVNKEGLTQADIAYNSLSVREKLIVDYYIKQKFKPRFAKVKNNTFFSSVKDKTKDRVNPDGKDKGEFSGKNMDHASFISLLKNNK